MPQERFPVDLREISVEMLSKILKTAKAPLKDAAAVNSTRIAIGEAFESTGLSITFWSGDRTKYNRIQQGYEKNHWIDAACTVETGQEVRIVPSINFSILKLQVEGVGHFV